MSNGKNSILLIEDSRATCMLINEFLKKLGYQDVYICNTGKAGIQSFSEMVSKGVTPVVFLDFHLPDMKASEIMSNILNIKPDARIIIETADGKNEEQIKSALRDGAYQYVEKPIRFENLKSVIKTLEEEGQAVEESSADSRKKIEHCLKSHTIISMTRLLEYSDTKIDTANGYISELKSVGKIKKIEDIKEISCNQCNSVRIALNFFCPSCKGSNFKQGKLIEHFKCGNVSIDESYKNNTCPKCRKEIKIIGVDYKAIDNYYLCNDCGDKFPEPVHDYICVRCNNRFSLDKARWITSEGLKTTV
ncbi:MAG TPA: response regulator [Candidatus Nitrosotalea sp.]|nr:response regulator [Candidatus Nitrosotalea sp.]